MTNATTQAAPMQLLQQMGLDEAKQWKLIKLDAAGPEQMQDLHMAELEGENLLWAENYCPELDNYHPQY